MSPPRICRCDRSFPQLPKIALYAAFDQVVGMEGHFEMVHLFLRPPLGDGRGRGGVGCSRDRVRRSAGRLASARSRRVGLVRRFQGTRVPEKSAAIAALSLPGADETLRQYSID